LIDHIQIPISFP